MNPAQQVTVTGSHITKMADRDILPDTFKPFHYDLVIKDLNFAAWTYNGSVT